MSRKSNGDINYYRNGHIKQGDYVEECSICGFTWPKKLMKRHWKTEELVCPRCNDERPRGDNKC